MKKVVFTILLLLTSFIFYRFSEVKIPVLDTRADKYFTDTIKTAGIIYATSRGLNAIISVLKESEVAVSVRRGGGSVAVGEVLDPVDDLVERFSNVVLLAIVSLGFQKIFMEVGKVISFKATSILFLFLIIPIWIKREIFLKFGNFTLKVLLLFMILRFLLPVSSLLNSFIYRQILEDKIEEAKDRLSLFSEFEEKVIGETIPEGSGIISKLKWFVERIVSKVKNITEKFKFIVGRLPEIIDALVDLAILYTSLFVIQCLLIPLSMLWVMVKIADAILNTKFQAKFFWGKTRGEHTAV